MFGVISMTTGVPGIRVRIEYSDQNESFAQCLPRTGSVSQRFSDLAGSTWYLVDLDEPIHYQMKVGEPFQYRLVIAKHILIRSRWEGQEVGGREPTSVFILLIENSKLPASSPIRAGDFIHVAWGTCHTI